MKIIIIIIVICSLFVSCDILNSSKSGEIEIKVVPEVSSIGDPVKLVIKNQTKQTVRYICGHIVERKQNEEWVEHTVTGCANAFPEEIQPGKVYEQDNFLLAPSEIGYYRAIVFVQSKTDQDISETKRVSNPVKFVDTNNE